MRCNDNSMTAAFLIFVLYRINNTAHLLPITMRIIWDTGFIHVSIFIV